MARLNWKTGNFIGANSKDGKNEAEDMKKVYLTVFPASLFFCFYLWTVLVINNVKIPFWIPLIAGLALGSFIITHWNLLMMRIVIGTVIVVVLGSIAFIIKLIIEGTMTLVEAIVSIAPILITIGIVIGVCSLIGIILYFVLKKKLQDKSNPSNINMDGSFVHTNKKIKSISISATIGLSIVALLIIYVPKIYKNYVESDEYKVVLKNKEIAKEKAEEDVILKYRGLKGTEKKAEYVKIGTYEQDNNTSNGKEAIEWVVLEKKKDRILVMSKQSIDIKTFNDAGFAVWENSSIRKWLNEDFINSAFNDNEKSQIIKSKTKPDKDTDWHEKEKTTKDKIFLLSLSELRKYLLDGDFKCPATEYVKTKDADLYKNGNSTIRLGGNIDWWIRTQGSSAPLIKKAKLAMNGNSNTFNTYNTSIDANLGVRPAMWIKTNNLNLEFSDNFIIY